MNLSKLKWKCRKGIRELDVLLTNYTENIFSDLSQKDQENFLEFLDKDTYEILDILMNKRGCDSKFNTIVSTLKTLNR
tara:strand:- start:1487 stop:1720 length:234 start_codon:yes stop_codon:yes gene_type:complete